MQIVKSREYRTAFQVESWDVERLVQHLGGDERVTMVAVELGDGSRTTLPHAGALSTLPNVEHRRIRKLWLESAPPAFIAADEDESRLALVQLRDHGSFAISYHVSGSDRVVQELSAALEDWVDSVGPWYRHLAFMDRPSLALRALLVVGAVGAALTAIFSITGSTLPVTDTLASSSAARAAGSLALVCMGLLTACATLVCIAPGRFFPTAQFRFGQGESRWKQADRRRNLAVRGGGVVIALAVLGSVAAVVLS